MKLTAITPARGRLVTLRFDTGEERCLDKTVWEESPYGVGSSFTDEQLTALCALSDRRRAEQKAVFLLSKRDLSRRELEQKLCREKGRYCPDRRDAAHDAVERMTELGYVNDSAYAARLAERLLREKGYPRRRLEEELSRRGLPRDDVRDAIAALDIDEVQLALAFLRKKRYTVPQDRQQLQRVAGALTRYGFGSDVIRTVLSQWEEVTADG